MPRSRFPLFFMLCGLLSVGVRLSWSQSMPARVPSGFIKNLEAGKKQTLVAFGTSLTAGGAWVGRLDAWLKAEYPGLATVHNEGASGHSSKYGLTLLQNVTRHTPDAVLVEFAMNDAYFPEQNGYKEGVPADTSRANLQRIIKGIQAARPACEMIPQTMNLPLGIHLQRRPEIGAYYAGYRAVSVAGKFILADHEPQWRAILDFDTSFYLSWLPDSIHPNAEASAFITFPGVLSALTGAKIELDIPQEQPSYPTGTDIAFTAAMNARAGTQVNAPVTRVEFLQGRNRIGIDSTAPFSFVWKGAGAGKHLMMARLLENGYPVAVSRGIVVTVQAATGVAQGRGRDGLKRRAHQEEERLARRPGFWIGRHSDRTTP